MYKHKLGYLDRGDPNCSLCSVERHSRTDSPSRNGWRRACGQRLQCARERQPAIARDCWTRLR